MARMGQTLAKGFGGEAEVFTDAVEAEAWLRDQRAASSGDEARGG